MDATNGDAITCVIADDHPAVLEAVSRFLVNNGVEVAASASDAAEALREIRARRPRVALLDVRMPGGGGTALAREVARSSAGTAVILYTGYGDRELLTEALDAGASGLVLKEAPLADLLRAVKMVADGKTYLDPGLSTMLADVSERLTVLTPRERDVLRLLADGLTNEQIGRQLFISPETVRTHVRKAMDRLDADTRTQAVAEALRRSLIG